MIVEVDKGVPVWCADVTSVAAENLATLVKVRPQKRGTRKVKIMVRCIQRKDKYV